GRRLAREVVALIAEDVFGGLDVVEEPAIYGVLERLARIEFAIERRTGLDQDDFPDRTALLFAQNPRLDTFDKVFDSGREAHGRHGREFMRARITGSRKLFRSGRFKALALGPISRAAVGKGLKESVVQFAYGLPDYALD
ncbi:hypothetical protein LCGC14_2882620, partial [marine sediment metagenome]